MYWTGPLLILGLLALAIGVRGFEILKGLTYPTVIFAAVSYETDPSFNPLPTVSVFPVSAGKLRRLHTIRQGSGCPRNI